MSADLSYIDRLEQRFERVGTSIFIKTYLKDTGAVVDTFEFTGVIPGAPVPGEVQAIARTILSDISRLGVGVYPVGAVKDANGNTVMVSDGAGNRADMPALPKMRAMVFGNSIANQSKFTTASGATTFPVSAVRQLNSLMQHTFVFDDTGDSTIGGQALSQGVWGYSGATSSQMVPYLAACLAAYQPGVVFLHLFENDLVQSVTLAESYANLKAAIAACRNAGAIPVVFTCLPSLSYTTTAHRDYFGQLNDLIFEYCASIEGAIPVDVSGAYIDTSNTYPQPLSTYTDASVHPTVKGNMVLAAWIYNQISSLFQIRKHRVNAKTDGNAVLAAVPNPCMAGTGGTAGTGASGTIAASWTASAVATSATMAVVCSKVADGLKESQNLAGTTTGLATVSGDTTYFYNANATTGFTVGEKIYVEIEVEITGTPVALKSVYGYVNFTGTSEVLYTENFQGSADVGFAGVYPSGRYVLRSPIYAIPVGTTGLRNYIAAKYNTGVTTGSFNLIVHSAVVRKVPSAQA